MIAPLFHGYSSSIAEVLRRRGHEVHLWHYDDHGSVAGRVRHKVTHELPQRLSTHGSAGGYGRRVNSKAAALLRLFRPEIVLAIKADVLMPEFWVDARAQRAITHLWLYDEVRRMNHHPEVLGQVDRIATYSALDARALSQMGLEPVHVPNGFDDSIGVGEPVWSRQILFVGARYPNREKALTQLWIHGLPVMAVGRDWSAHPLDRLRTWQWRRPPLPNRRDVPRSEAYRLMAGAAANVNSHYNQDGFTMRTFEIPGVGGLQLIDRSDIQDYFEPGKEVLVYSSTEELSELCHRALRQPKWAAAIAARSQKRTLEEHTLTKRITLVESQWD